MEFSVIKQAVDALGDHGLLKEIKARSGQTDLTQDKDIHELAACLKHDFGHIDLLVHSTGVIASGPLESATVEDFDWQYRTNVRGPYLMTQAL